MDENKLWELYKIMVQERISKIDFIIPKHNMPKPKKNMDIYIDSYLNAVDAYNIFYECLDEQNNQE